MYRTAENGWAEPFIEGVKISEYYQSQLLPPAYRLNGVVDAIRPRILYQSNRYREEKNTALVGEIHTPDQPIKPRKKLIVFL